METKITLWILQAIGLIHPNSKSGIPKHLRYILCFYNLIIVSAQIISVSLFTVVQTYRISKQVFNFTTFVDFAYKLVYYLSLPLESACLFYLSSEGHMNIDYNPGYHSHSTYQKKKTFFITLFLLINLAVTFVAGVFYVADNFPQHRSSQCDFEMDNSTNSTETAESKDNYWIGGDGMRFASCPSYWMELALGRIWQIEYYVSIYYLYSKYYSLSERFRALYEKLKEDFKQTLSQEIIRSLHNDYGNLVDEMDRFNVSHSSLIALCTSVLTLHSTAMWYIVIRRVGFGGKSKINLLDASIAPMTISGFLLFYGPAKIKENVSVLQPSAL